MTDGIVLANEKVVPGATTRNKTDHATCMGKAMPENDAFAWVRFCLMSQLRSEKCLMSLRLLNFHCFVKYRLRTRKCQGGNVY